MGFIAEKSSYGNVHSIAGINNSIGLRIARVQPCGAPPAIETVHVKPHEFFRVKLFGGTVIVV
jgi:hypothetical protein